MRIGLCSVDGTGRDVFPNLVLMKLSAWHKAQGHKVEAFHPLNTYDKVYASKVFSWTPDNPLLPPGTIRGGTGYDDFNSLPEEIEHMCPDYSLYPWHDFSMGFLTRGCIRNCDWCVVPRKEGKLHAHADFEEFVQHKKVRFLDNNVLASKHGIAQIEKLGQTDIKVDFNQGLDARLIDEKMAKRLAALKWLEPMRISCDEIQSLERVGKAVKLCHAAGVKPKEYTVYVLAKEVDTALERIKYFEALGTRPYCQPYREIGSKKEPEAELKHLQFWCNHKQTCRSTTWEAFKANGYKRPTVWKDTMQTLF